MTRLRGKRGVALVTALLTLAVIAIMLSILYSNTKTKAHTQKFQYGTTRAIMAANAAIQLAVYKYRALPSEYYKINRLENPANTYGLTEIQKAEIKRAVENAKEFWLKDFSPSTSYTAMRIKVEFDNNAKIDEPIAEHDFGVSDFKLISLDDDGYKKDYIKINAWGSYNGTRKDIEELVEVMVNN